ncbi:MAG: bacterial Ig-like domain-containing protein, partial [Clostridia bacterium]|nr:bacterial Ig-like domain-containing protein [Clostridia bacterium]
MRKRLSRIIVALAATLIALFLVGCGETSPSRVIVLKAESNRIIYELGDPLDLTVNAKYSDGSKADISDFEVIGYDENLLGPQTITVSFGGKSVELEIIVVEPRVVVKSVEAVDNKAESGYERGESLDLTVTAYYSDGTEETIENYVISGFDGTIVGTQTVTVSFEGKSAVIEITVNQPVLLGVELIDNKAESGYERGDSLDLTVYALYSDGSKESVAEYDYSGYDEELLGEQTVTVTYGGESAEITVSVKEPVVLTGIEAADNKADDSYEFGDSLDLTVYALYSDGSKKEITDYETSEFNNRWAGEQTITISYEGHSATVTVTVIAVRTTFPTSELEGFIAEKNIYDVYVPSPVSRAKWTYYTMNNREDPFFCASVRDTGKSGENAIEDAYTVLLASYDWEIDDSDRGGNGYFAYKNDVRINYFNNVDRFTIYVYAKERIVPIYPENVFLSGEDKLMLGKTTLLSVSFYPAKANQIDCEWSSSDESVATVEDGVVTSIGLGETVITVTTKNADGDDVSASFGITVVEETGSAWTVMIYICGSDLESESGLASADIAEILKVKGQPQDVNVIIETGGSKSWRNRNISANSLGRYHVESGQLVLDATLTRASMGRQSTFESFLDWGFANYPAQKTGVVLWNHGGGMDGVCFDELYGNDSLSNSEVNRALTNSFRNNNVSDKLEFIGYDACTMQLQDVADFNSAFFKYMVTSQETEGGIGWAYDKWIDDLYAKRGTLEILKEIADSFISTYEKEYGRYYGNDQTQSVLDLTKFRAYRDKFEEFASELKSLVGNDVSGLRELMKTVTYFPGDEYMNREDYNIYVNYYYYPSNWFDQVTYFGQTAYVLYGYYLYGLFDVTDFLNKLSAEAAYSSLGGFISE